jgi:hypothetical protein
MSSLIKSARGVKEGGILSGWLYNIYIDDLIKECVTSNLGAEFYGLIMNIKGFCDDLTLLSPDLRIFAISVGYIYLFENF